MVSGYNFRSMTHLELVFVQDGGLASYLGRLLFNCPNSVCWSDQPVFLGYFQFSCERLVGCTCLGSPLGFLFCSTDLSVSVPLPDCFHDHCPVLCLEVWNWDSFLWFLFLSTDLDNHHFYVSRWFFVSSFLFLRMLGFSLGSHRICILLLVICTFGWLLILPIQEHGKLLQVLITSFFQYFVIFIIEVFQVFDLG